MSFMMAMAWGSRAPMTTRSGRMKSSIAEPSRRNSGLETTENGCLLVVRSEMIFSMSWPVPGRHRGLGDDDLVAVEVVGDGLGHLDDVREIGRTVLLGRGADGDEDRQGAPDGRVEIGGEVEPTGLGVLFHQRVETRFVDRHLTAQQHVDLALVLVDAGDVDAEVGETRSGDQTHVAGTYHADVHRQPPCISVAGMVAERSIEFRTKMILCFSP